MSRPRTVMRKIREVLRLTFGEGLSRRHVGQAVGLPPTTVFDIRAAISTASSAASIACGSATSTPLKL